MIPRIERAAVEKAREVHSFVSSNQRILLKLDITLTSFGYTQLSLSQSEGKGNIGEMISIYF